MSVWKGFGAGAQIVMVAALAACGGAPDGPPSGTPPSAPGTVLILVLSGAGAADAAGVAAADLLAREPDTVVFERHYAASPDTERSVAALFSGFPAGFSAPGAEGAGTADATAQPPPVLAELFARLGYATYASVTDERLAPQRGFDRGFARYDLRPGMPPTEQRELVRQAVAEARGPFLGFVQTVAADRAAVEEWLSLLRGLDRFPTSLLLVTADHGTVPGEVPSIEARFRDPAVRVPCIVKFPLGARPETVAPRTSSLTSAVDLLPSLLALVGRDISGALPGSNIFDGYSTGHALVETDGPWAFVQDNHKLVVDGERRILFDLAADPDEGRDLAEESPERADALLASALQARTAMSAGTAQHAEEALDEETLEHLRSLGYIQ